MVFFYNIIRERKLNYKKKQMEQKKIENMISQMKKKSNYPMNLKLSFLWR